MVIAGTEKAWPRISTATLFLCHHLGHGVRGIPPFAKCAKDGAPGSFSVSALPDVEVSHPCARKNARGWGTGLESSRFGSIDAPQGQKGIQEKRDDYSERED